MPTAISIQNISKRYRLGEVSRKQLLHDVHRWWTGRNKSIEPALEKEDFWALHDISFDIKKGETVGLIGANGAGKSTLLKILSRITIPTSGKVSLQGRVGSLLEVGTGFHPELTGRDNVYLNGAILGMSTQEVRSKFDEIVQFADLGDFIDTPVKRYSSGMYVRLAFSVASSLRPEILILDEVLAVGDTAFRQKCFARVEQLVKSGHTILFVAHDSSSVLRFCNRVVWLEKGRVRFDGDAEEGCEDYRREQMVRPEAEAESSEKAALGEGVFGHFKDEEHTGSGEYHIQKFTIRNENDQPTATLRCGESCSFVLSYKQQREIRNAYRKGFMLVAIDDELGRRLLGLRSDFVGLDLSGLNDSGEVICRLPRLPLLPGRYNISFVISINDQIIERIIGGARLEVAEGDFYGSQVMPERRTTPVCVDFSWERGSNGAA